MPIRRICLAAFLPLVAPCLIAAAEPQPAASSTAENPSSSSSTDYLLQPFDLLEVVVFQEPDLQRQVRVTDGYDLALPLIGVVNVRGLTVHKAEELIRNLYNARYLVNPQINITVLEYAKVTVNVLGAVNSPGTIIIPPEQPLKLLDAITRAGGFSRLADRKHVKVSRLAADGRTATSIVNADEIIQSTTPDSWLLQKGDVIYVPERIL